MKHNNSKKVDQFKKDIDNLEAFAGRISKIHYTLSNKWLQKKSQLIYDKAGKKTND